MKNTYTYTARSVEHPEKVVTLTLHDDKMTVGVGAPLEQIEAAVATVTDEEETTAEDVQLWLKPLAIALIERRTGPFSVADVDADLDGDVLKVLGWVRVGGLRCTPITLIEGRVDNPVAAQAFADEVARRKEELAQPTIFLDYWFTWVGIVASLLMLFVYWRHRAGTVREVTDA
jgi:hypothetical protein